MQSNSPPLAGAGSSRLSENFHDEAFAATFATLRQAGRHSPHRPHRAMTPLRLTPFLLAQAVLLPLLLCALLYGGRHVLFDLWREAILWWSQGLGVPLGLAPAADRFGQYGTGLTAGADDRPLPSAFGMAAAAATVVVLVWASLRMHGPSLPLRYPIRIIAAVQTVALAYFQWMPSAFPYTISRHSEELLFIGYVMMLATPVMLAAGYYILNERLLSKIANTVAILAFLALLIPHQVMVQALVMHHFSVLYMPVLYLCFSAVFDALVFVALYSWIVSNVSSKATL